MRTAAIAATLVLLAVPIAGAELLLQPRDLPVEKITPGVEAAPFSFAVGIPCESMNLRFLEATLLQPDIHVQFEAVTDGSVVVSGLFDMRVPVQPCMPGDVVWTEHEMVVALAESAPGLVLLPVTIAASMPAGLLDPASDATLDFQVVGDYVARLQATVASKIFDYDGGILPIEVTLTNFGNAPTVVTPTITDRPRAGDHSMMTPDAIVLGVEGSGLFPVGALDGA